VSNSTAHPAVSTQYDGCPGNPEPAAVEQGPAHTAPPLEATRNTDALPPDGLAPRTGLHDRASNLTASLNDGIGHSGEDISPGEASYDLDARPRFRAVNHPAVGHQSEVPVDFDPPQVPGPSVSLLDDTNVSIGMLTPIPVDKSFRGTSRVVLSPPKPGLCGQQSCAGNETDGSAETPATAYRSPVRSSGEGTPICLQCHSTRGCYIHALVDAANATSRGAGAASPTDITPPGAPLLRLGDGGEQGDRSDAHRTAHASGTSRKVPYRQHSNVANTDRPRET